jgi:hypothetical protein
MRLTPQQSRTIDQRVSRSRVRPPNHGARPSYMRESVAASVGRRTTVFPVAAVSAALPAGPEILDLWMDNVSSLATE